MEIEEESVRRRCEERKSKNSSQIHLRKENTVNRPRRIVNFEDTSQTHLKMSYMANRPQRTLHEDEMETSELHRNVWTTP